MLSESISKIAEMLTNNEISVRIGKMCDIENSDTKDDKIILSIISIEEESTLKNTPNVKFESLKYNKNYPKIFLNLYVMFVSESGNMPKEYEEDLNNISNIIKFFQAHRVFEIKENDINGKITMELFTPSFEQLNHIWSMSGGKQYPSVMYKVRVVAMHQERVLSEAVPITEISEKFEVIEPQNQMT